MTTSEGLQGRLPDYWALITGLITDQKVQEDGGRDIYLMILIEPM